MLSGLFKPGWQSNSVEKRLLAIEKMDALDTENQSIFAELAKNDAESSVRAAAINKLSLIDVLFDISQAHADVDTQAKAEAAFLALIGPKSVLTEDQFRALITSQPKTTLAITRLCPYARLRSELVLALSESEQAILITQIEYSKTRQLIAQQLTSLELLEQARKALKGKDKSAEKIIKSKLDALHAVQKQGQEDRDAAENLCEKMEYLATHDWLPAVKSEFKNRYQVCSTQWQALDFTHDKNIIKRYLSAATIVSAEAKNQEEIEVSHKAQEQLSLALEDRCKKIASFSLQQLIAENASLSETLNSSSVEWLQLEATVRPNLNTADGFLQAQKALTSVISCCETVTAKAKSSETEADVQDGAKTSLDTKAKIRVLGSALSKLNWPTHYPALEVHSVLAAELAELKEQDKSTQKAASDKLDKLHKKINGILGATRRGDIGRAKRDLAAVTKAAKHYSGKDRIALDERLEKTTETVSKMGDWKDFATEPKYIELCEAMEALGDSTNNKTNPDSLAEKIAELQKRWKTLGHSDSSDQYWDRFKAAGDKAYEPCAIFFKQRRDRRRENLKSRDPFIEQTRELLENTEWDESPDYKQVESELRRITNDWQKIKDVEQGAGQKQWKRFSKLKSSIYEKFDLVYDANIALKKQLIEQAQALLEVDAKEETLNTQKQLQIRWKQVGITRRKEDQAAWTEFKTATDAVYEKIQGIRQEKRAEEDSQLNGYRQISRQIQDLAKTANALAEADSTFDRLQAEYQALPELPKNMPEKLIEGLAKDYQRASNAYSAARDKIKKAGESKELDLLAKKAALCEKLEQLAADASVNEIEKIQDGIAKIQLSTKSLIRRFEQRLAASRNPDRSEANSARRMLCIDLEILLGTESPKEDKELRMKTQIDRMKKQGIGREQGEKEALLNNLKLDWLCLPGADTETQGSLNKRFKKLIKSC